jgi:molybdopterin molybdotransferase
VITPEQAWSRIASSALPLGPERVRRADALGRRLAAAVAATTEVPASDVSALDGYALAGEVVPGGSLPVAGTVAAGDAPGAALEPGTAARIWTGAPLPAGADRVVGVEHAEPADGRVRLSLAVPAGHAVRRRGEILGVGSPLLEPGDRLGASALGLLASQGIGTVDVVRAPRVAVLTTGDEVVAADRRPGPGQLRDSHTDFLLAALRRLGAEGRALGIAPDELAALRARIGGALESADVLLVCGGVSLGGRDLTAEACAANGVEVAFHGVAVQPGKPLLFGRRGEKLVFGLPGNPGSVMVAFRLFVRPALARLAGGPDAFWDDAREAILAGPLAAGKARDRFVPARLEGVRDGIERIRPLAVRGSHDLATFGRADRLLRIRADDAARQPGERVEAVDWE